MTGTLVHEGLRALYHGKDLDAYLTETFAPALSGEGLTDEEELAVIMLEGYAEWLEDTGADVGFEVLANEEMLELEIIVPKHHVVLHGTPDLVVRTPEGQVGLFDHKTVAQFGQFLNRRLQFNYQLLTYSLMWWKLKGERPTDIVINMLRKVKRTAAAKPPFYHREWVPVSEALLLAHEARLSRDIQRMLWAEENGHFDPVPDQDCSWKCQFENVCVMLDEGSHGREMLNDLYVRRDGR